jgi:hypothetical protein
LASQEKPEFDPAGAIAKGYQTAKETTFGMPVIDETLPEFTLRPGRNMPIIDEDAPTPMPVVKETEGEKLDGVTEVKPSTSPAVETGGFQPQFPGQKFEGQTISQYMRGEDTPESRTFQALDPQGRLRQFQAPGVLAEQYAPFERESAAREARLEARGPMVGGPETAVRSGDALEGQISLNEARRIVDPEGKMSTPARTAAAQEYIRQEEIKIQDRARKDIDRQNEKRLNDLRIEGQKLQNKIRERELVDPKFDESVYARNLTQKVADIAEKFRGNPSYEPSSDERSGRKTWSKWNCLLTFLRSI